MVRKKRHFLCIILGCFASLAAYTQITRNFGDVRIHGNAQLGFYSSFQNDGMLTGNSGLMGFYGSNTLQLSGAQSPSVFNLEIANENGLYLDLPIIVNNNMNFIYGDIVTDRDQPYNYLDFATPTLYVGASDFSKVNGYIEVTTDSESYLFPTGDETFLRPLAVRNVSSNTILKCAYFFNDPSISISSSVSAEIMAINQYEFWKLDGEGPLEITLGWDDRSSISELTSDLSSLTVVGYHREKNEWVDLGAFEATGTLALGFVSSGQLIPDQYEAFTLGITKERADKKAIIDEGRYLVTPNDDGINDFLYIPALENYESNRVLIYNRYGRKVFEMEDYSNEFNGVYNLNGPVINRNAGLPTGVYFYIAYLIDEKISLQGYLYLNR